MLNTQSKINFTLACERGAYLSTSSLLIFFLTEELDFSGAVASSLLSSLGAGIYLLGIFAASKQDQPDRSFGQSAASQTADRSSQIDTAAQNVAAPQTADRSFGQNDAAAQSAAAQSAADRSSQPVAAQSAADRSLQTDRSFGQSAASQTDRSSQPDRSSTPAAAAQTADRSSPADRSSSSAQSDRSCIKPARLAWLATAALSLAYLLLSLSAALKNDALSLIALIVLGIASAVFKPNFTATFAASEHPKIWQIYYLCVNVGMILGLFSLPLIKARFGFSAAFSTCALLLVCASLIFASTLKALYLGRSELSFGQSADRSSPIAATAAQNLAAPQPDRSSPATAAAPQSADRSSSPSSAATSAAAPQTADRSSVFIVAGCLLLGILLSPYNIRLLAAGVSLAAALCFIVKIRRLSALLLRASCLNVCFYVLLYQAFSVILLQFKPLATELNIPASWFVSFMFLIALLANFLIIKLNFSSKSGMKLGALACVFAFLLCAFAPLNLTSALLVYALFGIAQLLVGSYGLARAKELAGNHASVYALWFLAQAAAQGVESIVVLASAELSSALYYSLQAFALLAALWLL